MKKTRLISCLLAAALLLALAGCAPGGEQPGEPSPGDPAETGSALPSPEPPAAVPFALPVFMGSSFHPVQCANRTNLTLMPLIYEGLFALDNTFTPQPVLCESWQADASGLTWTFTLRAGVTFSDGTPLTADRAAASLRAAMGADSRYANRLSRLKTVTADGDRTVTVTLNAPHGNLPALLDVPIYLEREDGCLGTGPYALAGTADSPALQARPDWWQGKSLPTREIPLTAVEQTEDLIHAFDTREAGLVLTDLTGTAALGYSASYEVWDYPTTTMIYLVFNTQSGRCGDLRLRQGMARGVDRASITNSLFARRVTAAQLPVSPASPLYDEDIGRILDYDVSMMNSLLEQSGHRGALTLVVNSENSFKASTADFLAAQWTGAGLEVTVKKLGWEDYVAALERGDFDLCLAEVSLTADFDLTELLASGGGLNYGRWSDTGTDGLLEAFRSARDGDARKEAARALYTHLAEQVPLVPVCFKNYSVLTQWRSVTGLTPTQNDPFYGLNWSLTQ